MAIQFASPSMRAAGSDLTVSISPLGLVELADEEFEVHGPRLNRYAQNWAYYLGHHWGYKRELGEAQITFNYVAAFSNYINNFAFGRGVHFESPREYEHIVPALLKRIWENDNQKDKILWEIGNQGSVGGDSFVKVVWEPPYADAIGVAHPGRVRILPLNAAFCFPEWHPHDRDRMLRFKLKYRFWGTSAEGTRQVFTYTEIITEEAIEEYINDELLDSRPNPLGLIPIVHIPNVPISGSPWGLADIQDIIPLNRQYNETFTDVVDIVNYHAAPVTVVIGAKANNLEKGAKKVWALASKDARVENLENGVDLAGPIAVLESIKRSMHELTGVPEAALGQEQAVSNTSGVALAIQYQPLMNRYSIKKIQYGSGLRRINEIALKTLFFYDPETLRFNPDNEGLLDHDEDQVLVIDPTDHLVYATVVEWMPPLPVDILVKLNEIQLKMGLGLQSKRGALHDLGEAFPDEKMEEVFKELVEDAKQSGALRLIKAQIDSAIMQLTGLPPEDAEPIEPQQDADGNPVGPQPTGPAPVSLPGTSDVQGATASEIEQNLVDIVTQAYGTKLPQRRTPDTD